MVMSLSAGLGRGLSPAAIGPGAVGSTLAISGTPAAATVGSSAVFTPTITGGSGSYTSLAVVAGALPGGRGITGLTVTGAYNASGPFNYTLRVTDSLGATADLPVSMTVAASAGTADLVSSTRARGLATILTTSTKQINSRTAHTAVGPISQLKIAYGNFQLVNNPAEKTGAGTQTIYASVEYPAGTFQRITWAGSDVLTPADPSIAISDYTTGDLGIPDGGVYWIRFFVTGTTAILYNSWRNSALGDQMQTAASGLTDATLGGTITTSFNNSVAPLAIITKGSAKKSTMLIGDSMVFGLNDTAESATAATPGYRGLLAKSFGPNLPSSAYPDGIPFVNVGTGSSQASTWTANAVSRRQLYPFFTHFIIQLGFNDFNSSARTAVQLQGYIQGIIDDIKASVPAAKITLTTITAKSTSTDSWATTVNQTTATSNAQRIAYNAMVRAGTVSADVNNGYYEIADQLETARDSGIWKVTGAAFGYTGDGIHPSPAGYDLIVASGAIDTARLIV